MRRWDRSRDPSRAEDIAESARDLQLDDGEAGLSVYRVVDEADRREVAVRFAITQRAEPQSLDYVVFPSNLATDLELTVQQVPCPGLDPFLSDRHFEILGLTAELRLRLAGAIHAHSDRQAARIRERDLNTVASELCRLHPEVLGFLKGSWPERLDPGCGSSVSPD